MKLLGHAFSGQRDSQILGYEIGAFLYPAVFTADDFIKVNSDIGHVLFFFKLFKYLDKKMAEQ